MRYLVASSLVAMRQRRIRAYRRLRCAWAASALVLLAGCKTVPVAVTSEPPTIACRQHNTADLQPPPYYVWEFPTYTAHLIGLLIEERRLRALEQDCIEQHRAKGVIR